MMKGKDGDSLVVIWLPYRYGLGMCALVTRWKRQGEFQARKILGSELGECTGLTLDYCIARRGPGCDLWGSEAC